jgi:hypothetical protein
MSDRKLGTYRREFVAHGERVNRQLRFSFYIPVKDGELLRRAAQGSNVSEVVRAALKNYFDRGEHNG